MTDDEDDDLDEFGLANEASPPTTTAKATPSPPTHPSAPPAAYSPPSTPSSNPSLLNPATDPLLDILGGVSGSPSFLNALQNQISRSHPAVRKISPQRRQSFQIGFSHRGGKKGQSVTIQQTLQQLFRGEKLVLTDTFQSPGRGTLLTGLFIGNRSQFPQIQGGIPSVTFDATALGNAISPMICQPGIPVSMTVEFLEDCDFFGAIFGTTVQ